MADRICSTCQFWEKLPAKTKAAGGLCRRHAPRPVIVFTGDAAPEPRATIWPSTSRDDGCGEWRAIEEA